MRVIKIKLFNKILCIILNVKLNNNLTTLSFWKMKKFPNSWKRPAIDRKGKDWGSITQRHNPRLTKSMLEPVEPRGRRNCYAITMFDNYYVLQLLCFLFFFSLEICFSWFQTKFRRRHLKLFFHLRLLLVE